MSIQYTADQLQRKFQGSPGHSGFARIAEMLREEGRHEEAVALCQEGLRAKPGHLTGLLVLGKCYLDMDRLDEAREQFESALRQDPRCLSAMQFLARIMVKLQWQDAAVAYYRSILELEPWDEETLALLQETSPPGFDPAAPAAPLSVPGAFAPPTSAPAGEAPIEEFDLNKVADFLPAESNPSELAGALQEVSLEDALSAPPSEAPAFPTTAAPVLEEPKPLDVLIDAGSADAEMGAGEPAPISGDDVGSRLDDLFGADDKPMTAAAPAADADADAGFADATLQLKAMRQHEAEPRSAETMAAPVEGASPLETSVFGVGELPAPEDRVSGEDIEQRLDDLFSLSEETRMRPAEAATAAEAPAPEATAGFAVPEAGSTADLPEVADAAVAAVTEPEPAGAPEPVQPSTPFLTPFEPASLDTILAAEPGLAPALKPDELVTGQDVADKLEALFGSEPPAPTQPPQKRTPFEPTAPEPPLSGSASWATARPAEPEAEPALGEAVDDGTASAASASAIHPSETWVESLEADPLPSSNLMSTESMLPRGFADLGEPGRDSAPPITGDDIEERLDSLFQIPDDSMPAAAAVQDEVEVFPASADETPAGEAQNVEDPAVPSPFSAEDSDRTVLMSAMKETADDWLARQAEVPGPLSADADVPAGTQSQVPAAPGGSETLFMRNEDVFAAEELPAPSGADTVGLEMVDGSDVAERLDQIFAPEDARAQAAKAAAEALARGEPLPEPEAALPLEGQPGIETGEMPVDEVALFAQDPEATLPAPELEIAPDAGTVVSGDEVKSRLSELFEEPEDSGPAFLSAGEPALETFPEPSGWAPGPGQAASASPSPVEPEADGMPVLPPTPPIPPASAGRAAPSLAPMQDEEEGSPEEEEIGPQSAAGANVATVTLAEIYFQQGLREQALQIYRQLLEREPENESVRKRIQEIEASKPEAGPVAGADPRRPRPGLKVPKRKK